MNSVSTFLHLSPQDRRLLFLSALAVAAVRVGLWLLPLRTLRELLARWSPTTAVKREGEAPSAERIAWAVEGVSRFVPGATCLTQALVAQLLLKRHGIPAYLQIGVAKDPRSRLVAHAWVESRDRVVIGGRGLHRYTRLPSIEELDS